MSITFSDFVQEQILLSFTALSRGKALQFARKFWLKIHKYICILCSFGTSLTLYFKQFNCTFVWYCSVNIIIVDTYGQWNSVYYLCLHINSGRWGRINFSTSLSCFLDHISELLDEDLKPLTENLPWLLTVGFISKSWEYSFLHFILKFIFTMLL